MCSVLAYFLYKFNDCIYLFRTLYRDYFDHQTSHSLTSVTTSILSSKFMYYICFFYTYSTLSTNSTLHIHIGVELLYKKLQKKSPRILIKTESPSHSSCTLLITSQPIVKTGDPLTNPCRNVDCTDLLQKISAL